MSAEDTPIDDPVEFADQVQEDYHSTKNMEDGLRRIHHWHELAKTIPDLTRTIKQQSFILEALRESGGPCEQIGRTLDGIGRAARKSVAVAVEALLYDPWEVT